MSRAGECLDNVKAEIVDAQVWPSRAAARTAIFAWLDLWYKRRRRHAARDYRSPVAWEEQVLLLQDAAA